MKITQIRNATIIVEYLNTKILIDPWLGPKGYMAGFEAAINPQIRQPRVDLPFKIKDIVNVDAVILTHFHPDHFDSYAAEALNKNIPFFVQNETDLKIIKSFGFNNVESISDNGIKFNNIELYKTNCQHGKKEIIKPLCDKIGMPYDAMGVVFKATNEKTLYLAGDTIWCKEVETAIKKFKPDIIILNACAATVANGERIIMNIEDIKEVLKNSPKSTIIASHLDTVSHLTVTRNDLKEFKQNNNIENLIIPDDGESIEY